MMQPAGHLRGRLRGSDPETKAPAKPRSRRNLQGGVSCGRLSTPHPLHGPDPLSQDLLPAPAPGRALSPPEGPHGSIQVAEMGLPAIPCIQLETDTHRPLMALKSLIPSAGPQIWTKSSRDIFSKSAPRQENGATR